MSTETVLYLLPELILVLAACGIFVGGTFIPRQKWIWSWAALAALLCSTILWMTHEAVAPENVGRSILTDEVAVQWRGWSLGLGVIFVMAASRAAVAVQTPEVIGSLLLITTGSMLAVTANDLVLLFASLELISIPTYLLLFLGRRDRYSQEAAAKYFFLSVLSSATLLYGFSFLYGAAGTTSISGIGSALAANADTQISAGISALALVLIFAGLAFRIAAVPFHFYAPDVYQGTTNVNAGLLSVIPKVAGIVVLIRLLVVAVPTEQRLGWQIALVLAILTMTLGNVTALWQNRIRRILAYSSIAQTGYLLIGISVAFMANESSLDATTLGASRTGVPAVLLYLITYALATAGTFAALAALDSDTADVDMANDLGGVGRSQPFAGICLAIFMFSLAGIPPLVGFWGKFAIFAGAIDIASSPAENGQRAFFLFLAIAGVLNAAIAAAYYLRIVAIMYFGPDDAESKAPLRLGPATAMAIAALLVIVMGLTPGTLGQYSRRAAEELAVRPPNAVQIVAARGSGSTSSKPDISSIDRPPHSSVQ